MSKKFTSGDYRWVNRKGFDIWRSQLDISEFSEEERKLFLDFWKGRDIKASADNVFGELQRFNFKKCSSDTVNIPIYYEIPEENYKGKKFNDWYNRAKFEREVVDTYKIGEIEVPNPSQGLVKFEGSVIIKENKDRHPEKQIDFLEWVIMEGSAYYAGYPENKDFNTPYSKWVKFSKDTSDKDILKSFGVTSIENYDDVVGKVNTFIDDYIKTTDLSETIESATERSNANIEELYIKYRAKDDEEFAKLSEMMDKRWKLLKSSPIFEKVIIKKETPRVYELVEAWEIYKECGSSGSFIVRDEIGTKFDHFDVYSNFNMKINLSGEIYVDRSGKSRIWVKPYEGIEKDYSIYLEEARKAWDEWLDKEVKNHSFR